MTQKRIKSAAPIYLLGGVWVFFALFLKLYRPMDYVWAAVISLLAYKAGTVFWPDKVVEVEEPPAPEPEPEPVDPELKELMDERDRAISEMRRLNDNIKDETISAQIDHLEDTTRKIFAHVMEHPQKKPQIRRFLNYYLPTTIKLLNAYDRMDAAGVSGANIDGTKGKIETMLDTIVVAFDKQLDALFGEEALDISTDITVLEGMMAREGLGGNVLKTEN